MNDHIYIYIYIHGCWATRLLMNFMNPKILVILKAMQAYFQLMLTIKKRAGMVFLANLDYLKTCLIVYVKFLKQACLPALLYDTVIWL